jgi:hypothetical protein
MANLWQELSGGISGAAKVAEIIGSGGRLELPTLGL